MKRLIKVTFFIIVFIIVIVLGMGLKVYLDFDVRKMSEDLEKRYSQIVLDERDEIVGVYLNSEEQWQVKGIGKIPKKLELAVINFEDRKFYSHNGVDYLAIIRALKTNLLEKKRVGASTITMQGIKLYERRERNYLSKFIEIIEAYKLESTLNKDEILQLYLNNAPYGSNIVGYETASLLYFKKKAVNLTWAEGALLAVLPNSPGLIHVEKNREKLLEKRNRLLKNMYDRKVINETQYRLALKEPLPQKRYYFENIAPHLTRRLVNSNSSKVIKTTLNSSIQKKVAKVVQEYGNYLSTKGIKNSAVMVVENSTGEVKAYIGSQDFYDLEKNGQIDGIMAYRSSGSVLKPFLYALSIDEGLIAPESKLLDIPLYFSNFYPQNANKKYHGLVEAKEALKKSLNIPFVNLLNEYGGEKFFYFLKDTMDFSDNDYSKYGLSLILGTKEVTLESIAKLYYGLANYGKFNKLKYLQDEKVDEGYRGFSKGASYLTIEALKEVQRYGVENLYTGRDNIAWKTGTSYGQRDAWASGITPEWTVVVWCGNFTGEGNRNLSGITTAGQLLFNIYKVLPNSNKDFYFPSSFLKRIKVDSETGYRLKYNLPYREILYPKDAKPLKVSPYYKKIYVNDLEVEIDSRDTEFSKSKEKIVLKYPVEFLDYLAKENIETSYIKEKKIKFIYPFDNLKIDIPRDFDGVKKVIVKVANPNRDKLYWYINGKYFGEGKQSEKSIDFSEGEQVIKVISQSGEIAQVRFSIRKNRAERK